MISSKHLLQTDMSLLMTTFDSDVHGFFDVIHP
jgi:hypothetical protein